MIQSTEHELLQRFPKLASITQVLYMYIDIEGTRISEVQSACMIEVWTRSCGSCISAVRSTITRKLGEVKLAILAQKLEEKNVKMHETALFSQFICYGRTYY